jgi:hypothetical protein
VVGGLSNPPTAIFHFAVKVGYTFVLKKNFVLLFVHPNPIFKMKKKTILLLSIAF